MTVGAWVKFDVVPTGGNYDAFVSKWRYYGAEAREWQIEYIPPNIRFRVSPYGNTRVLTSVNSGIAYP